MSINVVQASYRRVSIKGKLMQTLTINKLTPTYLRNLDWQTYLATAVAILIVIFSLIWMLLQIGGSNTVVFFADAMYAVALWVGASWVCVTMYRLRYGPLRLLSRHQLAWLLISLGMFFNGLGGAYYTYLEQVGQTNPIPSFSDIGFTLFYPLVFVGLLLMPTRQKTQPFRLGIALDASITTLCILGVSWYVFIGPTFLLQRAAHVSTAPLITALSYPFWDMLLILAIVLRVWRRLEFVLSPLSLFLRSAALLAIAWADTGYFYYSARGTYNSGTFYIDTFWFIGALLLGLSALYQYRTLAHRAYNERVHATPIAEGSITATSKEQQPEGLLRSIDPDKTHERRFRFRQSFLIYLPLSVLLIFMLYSELTQSDDISVFLVVLTAIVGVLVTMRYIVATRQNETLLREREQQREEAERLRLRLLATQLNEILELDPLLERIVTLATSNLGFDAAMLLLIENYEQAQHKPCNVLVRVAAAGSPEISAWRFQGVRLPRTLVLSGKALEVLWTEQDTHPLLPIEVHTCPQQRDIQATLFLPLTYQGKIQGTLGFSRRASQHFSQQEIARAEAFAEQAAIACTNARLYRQVQEAHHRQQELDQLKDMFMTTTSHELRTPLTAIQGYLELVTQYGEDFPPQERQEFLHKAQRCCEELVGVLTHIADASDLKAHVGKHSLCLEHVSVPEVIHNVLTLIEPRLRQEQRQVSLSIPAPLWVHADPVRLCQVLLNLSVNALKYSPPGTPIAFSAHTLTEGVVISVADKGQGIPPHDQTHLFQRFVRLERDINSPVRGSGLGLYISRRLIEAMDGKIEVESSGIEGAGSIFHIQLPFPSE